MGQIQIRKIIWHKQGMKKINLEEVRRNQPKTNFDRQIWESRNDCRVKVGGVGVEGMMTF